MTQDDAGRRFEVEIEFGASEPLRFDLVESDMREDGNPQVLRHLGSSDGADALYAAWEVVRSIMAHGPGAPISIFQRGVVWVVPVQSIRWVRIGRVHVTDPDEFGDRGRIVMPDEDKA